MNLFQFSLVFISAIFFTVTVYYSLRVAFVYRKIDRFFFYACSTLTGMGFTLFELLLSYPIPDASALFFHRLRMAALLLCMVFYLYCTYEIFFPRKSIIPRIYLTLSLLIGLAIPTDLFLSLPVRHIQIVFLGIPFDYRFGESQPFYTLYGICLMSFFLVSIFKVLLAKFNLKLTVLGILAFLPGIVGGLNDFSVSHGYLHNILISEYIVFMYLVATFTIFLLEDQQNFKIIQNMNIELERMVGERTGQLTQANQELSRLNEDLRKANDLKSELLGIAAHDLRNPLSSVMGYGELISRSSDINERIFRYANMIYKSSEKMLTLINELLESATLESGKLELRLARVNLARLAESVLAANEARATEKGQKFIYFAEPDCLVTVDEGRIREAMENLVTNALKYSPLNRPVRVRVKKQDGRVRFEVQDEGPGLSEADRDNLFKKFHKLSARPTAGESSTGLGLYIVKQLVELHGGQVLVESEAGQGSIFIIQLEATREGPLPELPAPARTD